MKTAYKNRMEGKTYKQLAAEFNEYLESGVDNSFTILSLKMWLVQKSGIKFEDFGRYAMSGHDWQNHPFLSTLLNSMMNYMKTLYRYKKVVRAGGFYVKRKGENNA